MADLNFDTSDYLNRNTINSIIGIDENINADSLKSKSKDLRNNIDDIIRHGTPWPQSSISKGFLPPLLLTPNFVIHLLSLNNKR